MEYIKILITFLGTTIVGAIMFKVLGEFFKGFMGFFVNVTKIRIGAAPWTEEQYDRNIAYIFAGLMLALILR
jgi:hypothetical protein